MSDYWSKHNKKTDKASNMLDDIIGISSLKYSTPKQQTPVNSNKPQKKKKKKSSQVIIVIDRKNPNKMKIRGFVAKKKREKKEKQQQNRVMYGL